MAQSLPCLLRNTLMEMSLTKTADTCRRGSVTRSMRGPPVPQPHEIVPSIILFFTTRKQKLK